MALTPQQIIDTVLMRLGNRQGNTALAAQALLELDLLKQEIFQWPVLPAALKIVSYEQPLFIKLFNSGDPMYFTGGETYDTVGYVMMRLAAAKGDIHGVKLVTVDGDYVNEPLTPISEDDWDVLRQEDSEANSTGRPKYYLHRVTTAYVLDPGDNVIYYGNVPHVQIYPYTADAAYQIGFSGYYNYWTAMYTGAQNLIIAGLGKRMAPYVRDANMLNLFTAEYEREKKALLDRDTAVEEEHKSGMRGDLGDR